MSPNLFNSRYVGCAVAHTGAQHSGGASAHLCVGMIYKPIS